MLLTRGVNPPRYLIAIVGFLLAIALRVLLVRLVGPVPAYFTFYPAVLLVAFNWGFGPGLLTACLSAAVAVCFFVGGHDDLRVWHAPVWETAGIFLVNCGVLCIAGETYHLYQLRRHRAEVNRVEAAAIKVSEQRRELLAVTLSSIGDGVIVTDPVGRITFINPEARRLTGWGATEAIDRPLGEVFRIINGETRKPVSSPVDRIIQSGNVEELPGNTVLISRTGRESVIDDSGAPVRDAAGVIHGVVLVFRDFTARNAADHALRESEERHRLAIDAGSMGTWSHDHLTDEKRFDARSMEHFGLTPEGGPVNLADRVHPDDADRVRAAMRRVFDVDSDGRYSQEQRVVRPDGSVRWLRVECRVSFSGEGAARKPVRTIGTTQDITERVLAEQSMRLAKEHAESASRAKDHFLAVVSHELRTPLTPVLAAVSELESRSDIPADAREDLTMIRRNVELEAMLVDDLLTLTRLNRGKIVLHQETINAHGMLQQILTLFRAEIEQKKLTIDTALTASRPDIWADPIRLQQALSNLVGNAVKFTPDGGRVTIRTTDTGNGLRIDITDTGIGIEPDVLVRLFNPFEQGERTVTRRFGGLGLGLSIAKQFIELHGGTLAASSDGSGRGATLTVEMNSVEVAPAAEPATAIAPIILTSAGGSKSTQMLTLLLVEDHLDTLRTMARLLKALGYHVTSAQSVTEAIAAADGTSFDLLLSDIGLPDGTGLDVVRELRHRKAVGNAVALSGFGQPEDVARSLEAGFSAHLVKPINYDSLRDALAAAAAVKAG